MTPAATKRKKFQRPAKAKRVQITEMPYLGDMKRQALEGFAEQMYDLLTSGVPCTTDHLYRCSCGAYGIDGYLCPRCRKDGAYE